MECTAQQTHVPWFHSDAAVIAIRSEGSVVFAISDISVVCQNVASVFLCTQAGFVYQTCYGGLGFMLSTWEMICN